MAGTVHEVENHALLAEVEREAANAAQELVEAARLHRGHPHGNLHKISCETLHFQIKTPLLYRQIVNITKKNSNIAQNHQSVVANNTRFMIYLFKIVIVCLFEPNRTKEKSP